jgi:hypothetical protein
MPSLPVTFAEDVINLPEEQARRSLVPSRTTLLGLVKHATFLEKVWFDEAHREACESSRHATSPLGLDEKVYGYRLGPLPLRWAYLHVLRELAQHCGHADIIREQILNG